MYVIVTVLPGETVIQRVSDGAFIPVDVGNTDYRAFLAWLDAGNVAAEAP